MLTIKDSFFDPKNEEEARQERLAESIFIRDVIKNICKDTLAKARKSNQSYTKLSKEMLANISKDIGEDEIRSTHFLYNRELLTNKNICR